MNATQKLVFEAYKNDPNCVNDENRLLEAVWLRQGWDSAKSLYWNLSRVSHPESLSRARRKLHELGLIKYSEEAEIRRKEQYTEMVIENGEQVVVFR